MYPKEILATIHLAHYFDSAFTVDQVYRYLRVKLPRQLFDEALENLKEEKIVFEKNRVLFTERLEHLHRQKKFWSKALFAQYKPYISLISKIPWVRYLALTGANSFESCRYPDDIDIFVITRKNRLWICYLMMVIFSKLSRKREILCINYLVDESNLHIPQQDYFTAVQILQMIPLLDNAFSQKILEKNRWVYDYLPNADLGLMHDQFYLLKGRRDHSPGKAFESQLLAALNRLIYRQYTRRLNKKYPREIGKGIVLGEGVAKLNRVNHRNIYQEIYREIEAMLSV